jgi:hypothetical protein
MKANNKSLAPLPKHPATVAGHVALPAVITFWLWATGHPALVVNFLSLLMTILLLGW